MRQIIATCFLALAASSILADEYSPWSESPEALTCPPSVVDGQPVSVTLAPGLGRELAVRRVADDAWFFLVVASPPKGYPQLMSSEQFDSAVDIELPASLRWIQWAHGAKSEKVFNPGLYELYISDNLESEVGGFKCRFSVSGLSPN